MLRHIQKQPVYLARIAPQRLSVHIPQAADLRPYPRATLFEKLQPQIVRRNPRVERILCRAALRGLDVAVRNHNLKITRCIHHPFHSERQIPNGRDLPPLPKTYRSVVARAPARTHEPFPLSAKVDELTRCKLQIVQCYSRLERRYNDCRAAAESSRNRNVAAQSYVNPMYLPVDVLVLQPKHRRLDVVAPIPRRRPQHVPNPLTVHEIHPVAKLESPHYLRYIEIHSRKPLRLHVHRL